MVIDPGTFDSYIRSLPDDAAVAAGLPDDLQALDWLGHARPSQWWPAGTWRTWLILAGRGFGKTRTGSETVRMIAASGKIARIALVGETAADVREVMIQGPDGIRARSTTAQRPRYYPSTRRLVWPNGVEAAAFSGCDPEQLRGPQHGFAWVDELAKFPHARDTWDNLMLGLRDTPDPRCLVTTTPSRNPFLRSLVRREGVDLVVTRGSTYENAENLPEPFVRQILSQYEGTSTGRQELLGELLDEAEHAIWKRATLDGCRRQVAPPLTRIVVGVDPSVSSDGSGDGCGIVAVGTDAADPPRAWVLCDATTRGAPAAWAGVVADLFRTLNANLVVAEGNQGGALVRDVLQSSEAAMPVEIVHASHSKVARAEPVAMLYDQGRVFHVNDLALLEDELVTWEPGRRSPNRLDALVWAIYWLLIRTGSTVGGEVF